MYFSMPLSLRRKSTIFCRVAFPVVVRTDTFVVSRLSDVRSKIQEDHVNAILLFSVILFFFSADYIIIVRFQASVILIFLYSTHIYALKISCRLSHFLTYCAHEKPDQKVAYTVI